MKRQWHLYLLSAGAIAVLMTAVFVGPSLRNANAALPLTNGSFDTDISSWSASSGNIVLIHDAGNGQPAGSMITYVDSFLAGAEYAESDCVTTLLAGNYDVFGEFMGNGTNAGADTAQIDVIVYDDDSCLGTPTTTNGATLATTAAFWQGMLLSGIPVASPGSMKVRLVYTATDGAGGSPNEGHWDGIIVTNADPATPTATNTATDTDTPVATDTPTATPTETATAVATDTPSATDTPTETATAVATDTPSATDTPTETATAVATDTAVATNTAIATDTAVATDTPDATATPIEPDPTNTNTAVVPVDTAIGEPPASDIEQPSNGGNISPAGVGTNGSGVGSAGAGPNALPNSGTGDGSGRGGFVEAIAWLAFAAALVTLAVGFSAQRRES